MFRYEKPETLLPKTKRRLALIKALSTFSLRLENLVTALWKPFFWILLFIALWVLQIPSAFGVTAEYIAFFTFLIGLWYLLSRGLRSYAHVNEQTLLRRIEEDSAVKHRPFSQIDDTLSGNAQTNETTNSLWAARVPLLQKYLARLKPSLPRSVLPARDPYGLRAAIIILLLCACVIAGQDWRERLQQGVFPFSVQITGLTDTQTTLTITPPAYTKLPARVISGIHKGDANDIPQGSEIKVQTSSLFGTPKLLMGENVQELEKLDRRNYGIVAPLLDGDVLKIKQMGRSVLSYPYTITPDLPPQFIESGDLEITSYATLRFPMTLNDDYGVRDLHIHMDLDDVVEDAPFGEVYNETRAVMTSGGADVEIAPVYDLTSHVWAGLPTKITFKAEDALGQTAEYSVNMTLPEREFKHPISIELIALRKTMAWNYQAPPRDIIKTLMRLLARPSDYNNDIVVFMGLRTAAARLRYSPGSDETAKGLIDLFWKLAIHLEDGDLNLARERLLQAQRELEQALNDPDLSDEDKARLLDNLRQAMADYLRELGREMQKRMAEGAQPPMLSEEMLKRMLDPESMKKFFDQLQAETLSGDPDSARELLSQLNKLMDMLDPSMANGMPEDMQMMSEGVNELQELIRRQEELLDQTREQSDQALSTQKFDYGTILELKPNKDFNFGDLPPPPNEKPSDIEPPSVDTSKNKVEQEALRYILGQLMLEADRVLNEIPKSMGLAEREMLNSSDALGEDNPYNSIPHQGQAIEHLREAMKDLSQQMMARMEQMTGMSLGQAQSDPLGRRSGNQRDGNSWFNGSEVEIPDEAERKRVEEILELLRKKSGEFERSKEELEYFRRLLKQF